MKLFPYVFLAILCQTEKSDGNLLGINLNNYGSNPANLANVDLNVLNNNRETNRNNNIDQNAVNPSKSAGLLDVGLNIGNNLLNENPVKNSAKLLNLELNALNNNNPLQNPLNTAGLLNVGLNLLGGNKNPITNTVNPMGLTNIGNNVLNENPIKNSAGLLDVGLNIFSANKNPVINAVNPMGLSNIGANPMKNSAKLLNVELNALNNNNPLQNPLNTGNVDLNILNNKKDSTQENSGSGLKLGINVLNRNANSDGNYNNPILSPDSNILNKYPTENRNIGWNSLNNNNGNVGSPSGLNAINTDSGVDKTYSTGLSKNDNNYNPSQPTHPFQQNRNTNQGMTYQNIGPSIRRQLPEREQTSNYYSDRLPQTLPQTLPYYTNRDSMPVSSHNLENRFESDRIEPTLGQSFRPQTNNWNSYSPRITPTQSQYQSQSSSYQPIPYNQPNSVESAYFNPNREGEGILLQNSHIQDQRLSPKISIDDLNRNPYINPQHISY